MRNFPTEGAHYDFRGATFFCGETSNIMQWCIIRDVATHFRKFYLVVLFEALNVLYRQLTSVKKRHIATLLVVLGACNLLGGKQIPR